MYITFEKLKTKVKNYKTITTEILSSELTKASTDPTKIVIPISDQHEYAVLHKPEVINNNISYEKVKYYVKIGEKNENNRNSFLSSSENRRSRDYF